MSTATHRKTRRAVRETLRTFNPALAHAEAARVEDRHSIETEHGITNLLAGTRTTVTEYKTAVAIKHEFDRHPMTKVENKRAYITPLNDGRWELRGVVNEELDRGSEVLTNVCIAEEWGKPVEEIVFFTPDDDDGHDGWNSMW